MANNRDYYLNSHADLIQFGDQWDRTNLPSVEELFEHYLIKAVTAGAYLSIIHMVAAGNGELVPIPVNNFIPNHFVPLILNNECQAISSFPIICKPENDAKRFVNCCALLTPKQLAKFTSRITLPMNKCQSMNYQIVGCSFVQIEASFRLPRQYYSITWASCNSRVT